MPILQPHSIAANAGHAEFQRGSVRKAYTKSLPSWQFFLISLLLFVYRLLVSKRASGVLV
jgi:hypothetical protein